MSGRNLIIFDTTLRDGEQAPGFSMRSDEKLRLARQIAKLGAEAIKEGIDSDMGAKHAKWFVTSAKTTGWLRETELVPKTQGVAKSLKEVKFAMGLFRHGKVPPPIPPRWTRTQLPVTSSIDVAVAAPKYLTRSKARTG